jgi:hypothetical protein
MIDDVVAILRAAKAGGYEWVTSPFLFLESLSNLLCELGQSLSFCYLIR